MLVSTLLSLDSVRNHFIFAIIFPIIVKNMNLISFM